MTEIKTEPIRDGEPLARYVLSDSWLYKDHRAGTLRPNAWMPHPKVELSVFRTEGWTETQVVEQGHQVAKEREAKHRKKILSECREYPEGKKTFRYHGRGEIIAKDVRLSGLDLLPKEPPPRHADMVNWPPLTGNKKHDEAGQMALAIKLNSKAQFIPAAKYDL
jgi:hypothetical protein